MRVGQEQVLATIPSRGRLCLSSDTDEGLTAAVT